MRKIRIPIYKILDFAKNPIGASLCLLVKVGWQELQLTEDQIFENACAFANGRKEPHLDNSIFMIEIGYDKN